MRADPARIAIARDMLAHLGITLADLADAERAATDQAPRSGAIIDATTSTAESPPVLCIPARFAMPTLRSYLPRVRAAAGPGANRTYGSYWTIMDRMWGERRLDQISATDIEALQHHAATTARSRRNSRHGRHAGEHVVAAARAIYTRATADGYLTTAASPAHRVAKPRRLPSTRRALTPDELNQINAAARTSGNDAILDALLLRLHTETACRRGGAIALLLADLDTSNCLIRLHEKGGTQRWQPVSPALADRLADHADHRGATAPGDALLRYRDGRPLTSRRYDHLWKRLGHELPWIAAHGISTHWLRHTTLTWVERHYGYGIARAYAGHTDSTGPATTTYIKANLHDVAIALAAMTGQPHPLANP
jgi:site-specific recombinase XerD